MQSTNQIYAEGWLRRNPENFPVASRLIPESYRANVLALYQFARGADEIADDPVMPSETKRKLLTQIEGAIMSGKTYDVPEWAVHCLLMAKANPAIATHARDLLSAFLQDTQKNRYRDMDELMHYCLRSAAPVGRAFLDIAGERGASRNYADALCNALQILNHVRDVSKDYLVLNRIYIPSEWMREAGAAPEDFGASRCSAPVRAVLDRALMEAKKLLNIAKQLPATIEERNLRLEIQCIYECAALLHKKLLAEDPLRTRLNLSLLDKLKCFVRAWLKR